MLVVLLESMDSWTTLYRQTDHRAVFRSLFQPLSHAVLSESSQQLVLVLSDPARGPWRLSGLGGCHHLLLHLSDLPPSSRGQHGGPGAVQCHAGVDSQCCLHHEDDIFAAGQWICVFLLWFSLFLKSVSHPLGHCHFYRDWWWMSG